MSFVLPCHCDYPLTSVFSFLQVHRRFEQYNRQYGLSFNALSQVDLDWVGEDIDLKSKVTAKAGGRAWKPSVQRKRYDVQKAVQEERGLNAANGLPIPKKMIFRDPQPAPRSIAFDDSMAPPPPRTSRTGKTTQARQR